MEALDTYKLMIIFILVLIKQKNVIQHIHIKKIMQTKIYKKNK